MADTSGADASGRDWHATLSSPPARVGEGNALRRWQREIVVMPAFDPEELALLAAPPVGPVPEMLRERIRQMCARREAALAAFVIHPGEFAHYAPVHSLEFPLPESGEILQLAALKELQARVRWWNGERAAAATTAAQLIAAGAIAARDTSSIQSWVTWLRVAEAGGNAAWWIAQQIDVEEEQVRVLSAALTAAADAWPAGMTNALRGEYTNGFRPLIERLPPPTDITAMLDVLAELGVGVGATRATRTLGRARKPLFDTAATLEEYGRPLAIFLDEVAADPVWRPRRFVGDFEHRVDGWMSELGVFGKLVFEPPSGTLSARQRSEILAVLDRVENPLGKLLIPEFTPNIDAIVYTGVQAEAQRRCVRVLVEWRRHILRDASLPVTPAEWRAAGVDARDVQDPFTGRELFFDAEKLRVWSVGIDGVNNGGRGDPRFDPDGADFAWSLAREPDEEVPAPLPPILPGVLP